MSLPPCLTVDDVLARYALRDRRAARKVMDAAGAFYVAGRLLVREDDLAEYERALRDARKAPEATTTTKAPRRGREAPAARKPPREPLAAGWWRDGQ